MTPQDRTVRQKMASLQIITINSRCTLLWLPSPHFCFNYLIGIWNTKNKTKDLEGRTTCNVAYCSTTFHCVLIFAINHRPFAVPSLSSCAPTYFSVSYTLAIILVYRQSKNLSQLSFLSSKRERMWYTKYIFNIAIPWFLKQNLEKKTLHKIIVYIAINKSLQTLNL